jgi:hypothetical protein
MQPCFAVNRLSFSPSSCMCRPDQFAMSPEAHHPSTILCLCRTSGILGNTGAESVLEEAGDFLEVSHAASSDGLSSLGLLAPVVCVHHCQSRTINQNSCSEGRESFGHVHFRVLAAGYPQEEQVCFWMWRERRPGLRFTSAASVHVSRERSHY